MKRLVLLTILLTGCASGAASQSSSSSSVDNHTDLGHKVLCEKYIEAAKATLAEDDKQHAYPALKDTQMTKFGETFFSKSKNSCLYTWYAASSIGTDIWKKTWGISDALTGEIVVTSHSANFNVIELPKYR